jgi:hypothetical protein
MDTAGIMDRMIYTKSSHWNYEKEWRMSAGSGRDAAAPFELCPFGLNDIDGIIFGLRTSNADKLEIRRLAESYPNIQFFEAQRERSHFGLQIAEI